MQCQYIPFLLIFFPTSTAKNIVRYITWDYRTLKPSEYIILSTIRSSSFWSSPFLVFVEEWDPEFQRPPHTRVWRSGTGGLSMCRHTVAGSYFLWNKSERNTYHTHWTNYVYYVIEAYFSSYVDMRLIYVIMQHDYVNLIIGDLRWHGTLFNTFLKSSKSITFDPKLHV